MLWTIFILLCIVIYLLISYFKNKNNENGKSKKALIYIVFLGFIGLFIETILTDTFSNITNTIRNTIEHIDPFKPTETYIEGMKIVTGIGECQININEEMKLSHSISPSNASNYELYWTSSNPSVIEVDNNGTIKANSIGVAKITASFKNFPDLDPTSIIVYAVDSESYASPKLQVIYDQICPSSVEDENWYVFFNIENPNNIYIKECRVEAYDIYGVMTDSQTVNSSVLCNFTGYFKLDKNNRYIFVGYVISEDGTEYRSDLQIISSLSESDK